MARPTTPPPTAADLPRVVARFRLDVPALALHLLPALLRRGPRLRAWLLALVAPLAEVYDRFLAHYYATRRELSYTGQTMSLEQALNDRFDPAFRRIVIVQNLVEIENTYDRFTANNYEGQGEPPGPTFFVSEPGYVPRYDYDYSAQTGQAGFIVRAPRSLQALQDTALNARIGQLKLALITYRIAYV